MASDTGVTPMTPVKQYDLKDSNVELIGSDIDHQVKYNSAQTEPAWTGLGQAAGLHVFRIEQFEVVPWPKERTGEFFDGDSYIVLHSYKVGKDGNEKLGHDIFFWLGSKTSQDEAGVAAYKTVELDEFLHGVATQYREVQEQPSDAFLSLFPNIRIMSGGVRSGFRHVDPEAEPQEITMLLRIFKVPGANRPSCTVVYEVQPTWQSLDDEDVFVLDKGNKIWVWQGKGCSPMEKAKAAQVVSNMTLAKHIDVEVLSQTESRSRVFVDLLGGEGVDQVEFKAQRPAGYESRDSGNPSSPLEKKLFRLSDATGTLSFDLVKDGEPIQPTDFDSRDVFLLDIGRAIWVWRGLQASARERAMWITVAQSYVRQVMQNAPQRADVHLSTLASAVEGNESPAFFKALEVAN